MKNYKNIFLIVIVTLTLSACGGSSNNEESTQTQVFSGRIASVVTENALGEQTLTEAITYDELGNLSKIESATETTLYTYDNDNRLISMKSDSDDEDLVSEFIISYEGSDINPSTAKIFLQKNGIRYQAIEYTFSYNDQNQLTSLISDVINEIIDDEIVADTNNDNDMSYTLTYSASGLLAETAGTYINGNNISHSFTFTYGDNNKPMMVEIYGDNGTLFQTTTHNYGMDNELIALEEYDAAPVTGSYTERTTYTYEDGPCKITSLNNSLFLFSSGSGITLPCR